ncbi:nucleotidyl transferase AbiEii/AbiGii toxin family protein [Metamycoplasma alkalescens]|uniref:Nucleotidyltransferase AbiEii toxin of type IV toxin-antitoxin system n=2 Tax=Metamycoplasma alkalescens TaxID=45363 RepID=A0A318U5F7_9BACT|nr:nucleotidyl transferase AbiEii/AbiGii toxin family protein [Metamycoplasma alkalescens]PYF41928.1 nucleotidyltransferase AbiEii toxin of type IV toxin-antitoxin system [Metamycoplasma alkalescens]
MLKILNLPKFDLNLAIEKTSQKTGISEDIIEKNLWVCFVLKYLFTDFLYKNYLVFKGGTSLSKGFNYIKRFSEDIDIVLDWKILNLLKLKDVYYDEKFINRKRNEATNNLRFPV